MRIKKNGKVIRLTESDLQKIVKRILKESNENPTQYHRYRDGSNPGIEDFFQNPTDRTLQDRLKQQLNDDVYSNVDNPTNIGKGTRKLFIYFNGRKMTIERFIDQVQRDGEDGYCHVIDEYEYDNKVLGATKITIKTEQGPCEEEEEEIDVVVDKPIQKEKRNECSEEWRDNVIGIARDNYPNFWEELIPKMGSSKGSICNCFKKEGDIRMSRFCESGKKFPWG
tara:strand:+ start:552 stop:1223 length:672 start_codon:yes stop_codon:yes gene_type:complete